MLPVVRRDERVFGDDHLAAPNAAQPASTVEDGAVVRVVQRALLITGYPLVALGHFLASWWFRILATPA